MSRIGDHFFWLLFLAGLCLLLAAGGWTADRLSGKGEAGQTTKKKKAPAARETPTGAIRNRTTNSITEKGREIKMKCPDHPDIARAERTGYGLPLDEIGFVCCPACGEELWHDDTLYMITGQVVGCSHCVETESVDCYMDNCEERT